MEVRIWEEYRSSSFQLMEAEEIMVWRELSAAYLCARELGRIKRTEVWFSFRFRITARFRYRRFLRLGDVSRRNRIGPDIEVCGIVHSNARIVVSHITVEEIGKMQFFFSHLGCSIKQTKNDIAR